MTRNAGDNFFLGLAWEFVSMDRLMLAGGALCYGLGDLLDGKDLFWIEDVHDI